MTPDFYSKSIYMYNNVKMFSLRYISILYIFFSLNKLFQRNIELLKKNLHFIECKEHVVELMGPLYVNK